MITIETYKKNLNILYIEDDIIATVRLKNILSSSSPILVLSILTIRLL
jgi:hypothetical protein